MDIYYIWIGDFDPSRVGAYNNPNKMVASLFTRGGGVNRIHFVENFCSVLDSRISVHSIESSLNLTGDFQHDTFAQWAIIRLDHILKYGIGTIREIVTVKECFSLWLAYIFGGYIVDAGCSVADLTLPVCLPKRKYFTVPCLMSPENEYEIVSSYRFPEEAPPQHRVTIGRYKDILFNNCQLIRSVRGYFFPFIDNWLFYSNPRDVFVKIALEYSIDLWPILFPTLSAHVSVLAMIQAFTSNSIQEKLTGRKKQEDLESKPIPVLGIHDFQKWMTEYSSLPNFFKMNKDTEGDNVVLIIPELNIKKTLSPFNSLKPTGWREHITQELLQRTQASRRLINSNSVQAWWWSQKLTWKS